MSWTSEELGGAAGVPACEALVDAAPLVLA